MRLLELQHHHHRRRLRGHGYFKRLGPGIVTGAADDDPSGIGTYSQVGAAFGFGLLWTTLATLPLAVGVQEATARLGLVTGKGLAGGSSDRRAQGFAGLGDPLALADRSGASSSLSRVRSMARLSCWRCRRLSRRAARRPERRRMARLARQRRPGRSRTWSSSDESAGPSCFTFAGGVAAGRRGPR